MPRSTQAPGISNECIETCFALQHQELTLIRITFGTSSVSMIHDRADASDHKEHSFEVDLKMPEDFPFDLPTVKLLVLWPLNYHPHGTAAAPQLFLRDKRIPHVTAIQIQSQLDRYLINTIMKQEQDAGMITLRLLQQIRDGLLERWALSQPEPQPSTTIKLIPASAIQIQPSREKEKEKEKELEKGIETLSIEKAPKPARVLDNGISVSFRGANLTNIALVEPLRLKMQLVCHRCQGGFTTGLLAPLPNKNTPICPSCKASTEAIVFEPRQYFEGSSDPIAMIQSEKAQVVDILLSEYRITCSACPFMEDADPGQSIIMLSKGQTQYKTCFQCHASIGISVPFIELKASRGNSIKQTRSRAPNPGGWMPVPGKPLPEYGTCKHYKKSYRWLRFPCCGAAYPCDQCHDLEAEKNDPHSMQWATRMICGFCSKEQPFSQTKPCSCGKTLSTVGQKKATFWEGGKGSRDAVTMSRKDNKKYRLLGKKSQ